MHFQSVNYKADKKLKDFAKKRIEKLSLYYNQIIEVFVSFVKDNIYILPLIIVIRYGAKILQTYLMKTLEVTVEKNLRVYVMTQIFKQKDFSISDAYFYIN